MADKPERPLPKLGSKVRWTYQEWHPAHNKVGTVVKLYQRQSHRVDGELIELSPAFVIEFGIPLNSWVNGDNGEKIYDTALVAHCDESDWEVIN